MQVLLSVCFKKLPSTSGGGVNKWMQEGRKE